MDDKIYWHRGRNTPPTSSSVLISSSPYLNDARFREWISTEALRKNGPDYPLLFGMPTMLKALNETQDSDKINAMFAEERTRNPKLDAWFNEGFVSTFTKDDLRRQPKGSIGRILFEYMDENGFELELSPERQADPTLRPKNDFEYWKLRSGQTHDFDHILAEIGFDYISESFPAFFRIGNLFAHFSPELAGELSVLQMFISWPWFMRTILHYPTCWPAFFDGMVNGYACGQASDMINMARYDDILHLTPAEARGRVGMRKNVPADTNALSAIWYGTATMRVNDVDGRGRS